MKFYQKTIYLIFLLSFFLYTPFVIHSANASSISELRSEIDDRNTKIQELEKEIVGYQKILESIGKEKDTLQNAIQILEISGKKLSADMKITEGKIGLADSNIGKLSTEISDKKQEITQSDRALSESIKRMHEFDSSSLVEIVIVYEKMSDFWNIIENLEKFQSGIKNNLDKLRLLKEEYTNKKLNEEQKRRELANLRAQLSDQKKIVDYNKIEQSNLLKETKNKESNYKNMVAEKLRLKEQFEKELLDLESELQITIDPNSIPKARAGILDWPLDSIFITQYFGDTPFSRSGAYSGKGHNGIDFRASVGTKIKASLGGVVTGTGNTDESPGCYSYGKWILIKHENGLSTLYAHLSLIKVNTGETVNTGDIIGYSGNTGYSTGPHLHLTVYATQGVKIVRLGDIKKITNCGNIKMPVAPLNAYLNPLNYLQ
ncbi:peptidoglycan DD-metalloendopeptidase family protein [Patescibacteria group bacterium]|nr:peptidoglycan DD-metalloendopeptidase family protein [Patescibacteria group bacterium]MBU4057507.1 peptidoglycan DD-metalloendopeptidase family protein [Patescibacteria group bacterium]MBU4116001.1 peptidoglycan DD-metalloendopeptidase family protein [Patescibacteria group bacterium]